jgi:hypothetical protein
MAGEQVFTGPGGASVGRNGPAIPDAQPLVSDLPRAAALLRLEPRALEAAVATAQLEPWGEHAQGMPVYSWSRILEVATAAGLPVPDRKGHAWRARPTVRRVTPYGQEKR